MATKVTLNSAAVKALLGSEEVSRFVVAEAERRAAGTPFHVRPFTSGGYRAVADIVDDRPGAIPREAHTGGLAATLGGAG